MTDPYVFVRKVVLLIQYEVRNQDYGPYDIIVGEASPT